MPLFFYKATDASGKIVRSSLEAVDELAVAARIQEMGLIPIRIATGGQRRSFLPFDFANPIRALTQRVSGKDLMLFTQDLASLLEAGLPVDRSLAILVDVCENEKLKKIVSEILKAVQGGSYLSDALSKYPHVFSDFYVNMVRAGETGGVLEEVLNRLGIYLQSTQDLMDFIKSALVYPIFLIFVSGISIIILMAYVVPKFAIMFTTMGTEIPWSTRLLLNCSDLLRHYWWLLLGSAVAGAFFLHRYQNSENGRFQIDRIKLRLPIVGELVKKIEVARFARTLGTLTRSGVPILQGLDLVTRILDNRVIAQSMKQVFTRVKEGDRLAPSLESINVFPSLALQMITVGEETGRLEEMLLRVADNYEKALRNIVKRFISLLEPAMILAMAVIVGFIVISMLMAIFSMNELPF